MLHKDLISRARQSKLGRSIADIVSRIDRDKQKPGFQFTTPQTRQAFGRGFSNIRGNIGAISDPSTRGNFFRGLAESINKPAGARVSFTEAFRKTKPIIAQDFGQVLRAEDSPLTNIPGVRRFTRATGDAGQAIASGAIDIGTGISRINQPFIQTGRGDFFETTAGSAQLLRGVGRILSPTTPFFQAAALTAGGVGDGKDLSRRFSSGFLRGQTGIETLAPQVQSQKTLSIPFLGDIDPIETVGSFLGFVKNPVNKELFKLTNVLFPSAGNIKRFLASTAVRGSVEQLIFDLPDLKPNANDQEKAKFLINTMVVGTISELIGQGILKGFGKIFSFATDNPITKEFVKNLSKTFDELTELKKRTNVQKLFRGKGGRFTGEPLAVEPSRRLIETQPTPDRPLGGFQLSARTRLQPETIKTQNIFGQEVEVPVRQAGFARLGGEPKITDLKPKTTLLRKAGELEVTGQQELDIRKSEVSIAREQRDLFSSDQIKKINRLKAKARSKTVIGGDIETLRKKDPKLIDDIIGMVREVQRNEFLTDTNALDIALNLPLKGETRVSFPPSLREARKLRQEARSVRNLVFNSETDLKVKEKAVKDNLQKLNSEALADFKEWEKQLKIKEDLKTSRGQQTRNIRTIQSAIKQETFPEYISPQNIKRYKDIGPLDVGLKDVYRNFDTVFGKDSQAKRELLLPFDTSKSKLIDDLSDASDSLKINIVDKYGFEKGSRESAAIQQFGEKNRDFASLVEEFGEIKANQIIEADNWFRGEYNRLLDDVNRVRSQIYPGQMDKIIRKRNDYYRHFVDLSDTFSGLRNLFDTPANISPKLAGVSARTKPKSKWLSFAQERLGNRTDEDAIGGYIEYAKAQSYAKNIDPHIDRFRKLQTDLSSQMDISSGDRGKLNNFIEFLDDFSNDLAGKTNPADRALQKYIGRKPFKVLSWVNSRTKANLILGNLSSSIAQFFNIPQGIAETGLSNSFRGVRRSVASMFGDNKPMQQSEFIKTRYGDDVFSDFDKGVLESTKKIAIWITRIGDEIGTKFIWNSAYEKALIEGSGSPLRFADDIARNMVAGRGIGEVPLLQKAKSFQLIAPFQLEVTNVWHVMKDWAGEKAAGKFIIFFVASHIMNKIAKSIRGSDVSLDPIQASIDAYTAFKEEENRGTGALKAGGRLGGEVLSNIPLGQSIASVYPEFGVKFGDIQLPTRSALFGEGDPTRFGSGPLFIRGLTDPLAIIPPFGGQQIKRTITGIQTVARGFSESRGGKIRTPIEQSAENRIRGAIFGEFSIPEVREFFDANQSVLGEKQTETFKKILDQKGMIDAKSYYDSILDARDVKRQIKVIKETGKVEGVDVDKITTKQAVDLIKAEIEAGLDVSETELYTAFLNKPLSMPATNRFEKSLKDSKLFSSLNTIETNETLSDTQKQVLKQKIADTLNRPVQDLETYQVAKQNTDTKTLFVLDQIDTFTTGDEMMRFLIQGRKPVNGKLIISDGVITNLVDDGILSAQFGKELKRLDINEDGSLKRKRAKIKTGRAKVSARSKATKRFLTSIGRIGLPQAPRIRTQGAKVGDIAGITLTG